MPRFNVPDLYNPQLDPRQNLQVAAAMAKEDQDAQEQTNFNRSMAERSNGRRALVAQMMGLATQEEGQQTDAQLQREKMQHSEKMVGMQGDQAMKLADAQGSRELKMALQKALIDAQTAPDAGAGVITDIAKTMMANPAFAGGGQMGILNMLVGTLQADRETRVNTLQRLVGQIGGGGVSTDTPAGVNAPGGQPGPSVSPYKGLMDRLTSLGGEAAQNQKQALNKNIGGAAMGRLDDIGVGLLQRHDPDKVISEQFATEGAPGHNWIKQQLASGKSPQDIKDAFYNSATESRGVTGWKRTAGELVNKQIGSSILSQGSLSPNPQFISDVQNIGEMANKVKSLAEQLAPTVVPQMGGGPQRQDLGQRP